MSKIKNLQGQVFNYKAFKPRLLEQDRTTLAVSSLSLDINLHYDRINTYVTVKRIGEYASIIGEVVVVCKDRGSDFVWRITGERLTQ